LLRFKGVCIIIISKTFFLFVGLVLLFSHTIFGKELVIAENNFGEVDLKGHIAELLDTHHISNWNQLDDNLWDTLKGNVLNGGLTELAYWYKINIKNLAANQYLVLNDPQIDQVDVYFVKDSSLIRHSRSGDAFAFEKREVKIPNYHFLLPQDSYTCYFRIKKNSNFTFNLNIASFKYLMEQRHNNSLFSGAYLGVLFVLIFFNYFVYLYVKEKFFLYYIFYLSSMLFFLVSFKGFSFEYLWPNSPYYNSFFPSYGALMLISIALFVMSLLQTKTYLPRLTKGLYLFIGILILGITSNFYSYAISSAVIQYITLILVVYLILIGIQSHRKGNKVAKFFLCSWSLYMSCLVIFIVHHNGLIVSNEFTRNAIIYGSLLEAVTLSFVSAYRLKILRREKDEAMSKLKKHQSELVQSEIMNSLGKMSVGISHKINNNIQLSGGNLLIIDRNLGFLKKYFEKFENIDLNDGDPTYKLQELRAYGIEIELKELFKELFNSLFKVQKGINQTTEISRGLNYFSKSDANRSIICTNINRDISSMILLQRTLLPGSVKVDLDLGELPEIHCKAKDLNQSFLSVFETAVSAIRAKPLPNKGVIKVKTQLDNDTIIISFEDDGVALDKEALVNVFKPFQLNRVVGNKGLGLSFAYNIVSEHGGDIVVESIEGKGSVFTISLPLK